MTEITMVLMEIIRFALRSAISLSLIDNIYAQGQVLARKYRLLKFAYQFFMIGLSAVVIMAAAILIISH